MVVSLCRQKYDQYPYWLQVAHNHVIFRKDMDSRFLAFNPKTPSFSSNSNIYILYTVFWDVWNNSTILVAGLTTSEMNRIKEVLGQKGIKQTWLAEKLGKSYNMVNAYAQNRQQPRLETLIEIADILDVDVKDLIVSTKEPK